MANRLTVSKNVHPIAALMIQFGTTRARPSANGTNSLQNPH